jgi:hypothetical protein
LLLRNRYHDWIDDKGDRRSYFYVDIAFVAIIAGVASPTQTTALLHHYDARLAEIYTEYDVLPGSIWSPPANLYPVTDQFEYASQKNFNGTGKNWSMTFPMYHPPDNKALGPYILQPRFVAIYHISEVVVRCKTEAKDSLFRAGTKTAVPSSTPPGCSMPPWASRGGRTRQLMASSR